MIKSTSHLHAITNALQLEYVSYHSIKLLYLKI